MTSDRSFWKKRYGEGVDIRTVGRRDRSIEQNEDDYSTAGKQFRSYVTSDLGSRRGSILDLGYGLGHYAKICHELGFVDYVGIDFVAPAGPSLGRRYVYQKGDVGEAFDLGRAFDLVIAIDVLFHVTDEDRFETALQNIRKHASGAIYVTGMPRDQRLAPHVLHRGLDRFRGLGELIAVTPWRDTSIMRFRANSGLRTASDLAIAMTTAPRREPTLERSLQSLRSAGFDEDVHVFAEPGSSQRPSKVEHVFVHVNPAVRGCFGNWKGAIEWLLSNTSAQWLMVLQDDSVWSPGSGQILRRAMHARKKQRTGFISPYTSSAVVTDRFVDGWNECGAGWNFWGALALCLDRPAAEDLLKHSRFAGHVGTKQVDAVVAQSMIDLGRPSYVYVPSLVDHIGTTSTIGRDGDPAGGRRGYRFGGEG